ncbi:unnamed protein product [Anisakis simplex]|uniref:Nucleos_tra2_N domain-containing protein n=1 Tax=Anisakis simplex TaxID=6269 RepID=A0A0M3J0E2_ANISI|nr:unnamed protein product [Anisakis simplex]
MVMHFTPQSILDKLKHLTMKINWFRLRLVLSIAVGLGLFAYVLYGCIVDRVRLISLASFNYKNFWVSIRVLLHYIQHKYNTRYLFQVKWSPVLWGILLQYVAGFVVLKWSAGQIAFQWATEQLVRFLDYTSNGTTFVFGFVPRPPNICGIEGPFSFTSLPIIIFFASLCSTFYYLGVVQWFLLKMAICLQYSMGTTAAESLNAVASVFLGPVTHQYM